MHLQVKESVQRRRFLSQLLDFGQDVRVAQLLEREQLLSLSVPLQKFGFSCDEFSSGSQRALPSHHVCEKSGWH